MKKEKWLPIIETNETFAVSNLGNVKRIKDSLRKGFSPIGKIIKPGRDGGGYAIYNLTYSGKSIMRTGQRLVADAFLGERPKGHEVNHKNGIKFDNSVQNLEYVTRSQNHLHALHVLKIRKGNFAFTLLEESKIKKMLKNKETITNIANSYSVSRKTIRRIKTIP